MFVCVCVCVCVNYVHDGAKDNLKIEHRTQNEMCLQRFLRHSHIIIMINDKQFLSIKQNKLLLLTYVNNVKETKFQELLSCYVVGFYAGVTLRSSRV